MPPISYVFGCLAAVALIAFGVAVAVVFIRVFARIALAKAPIPGSASAEVAAVVEHGYALSEIGMAWAELSRCAGLKLTDEWGGGRLALLIRQKIETAEATLRQANANMEEMERDLYLRLGAVEDREAALLQALKGIAECEPTGRNSLVALAQKAIAEHERSRAGGGAADTAQGQGSTERGNGARAGSSPATAQSTEAGA